MTEKRRLSPEGVFLEAFIIGAILGTISIWLGFRLMDSRILALGWLLWIMGILFGIWGYFREKSIQGKNPKNKSNKNVLNACIIMLLMLTGFTTFGISKVMTITETPIETELPPVNATISATIQRRYQPRQGMDIFSSSIDIPPGGILELEVSVSGVTDMYCWAFDVEWNPEILSLYAIDEGPFLASGGQTIFVYGNSEPGSLEVFFSIQPKICTVVSEVHIRKQTRSVVYHRHIIFLHMELLKPCISRGRSCGGAANFGNGTTTAAPHIDQSAPSHLQTPKLRSNPNQAS